MAAFSPTASDEQYKQQKRENRGDGNKARQETCKRKRTYLAPDCVSAAHGQKSWLFCKHFFSLSLKIYLFTYSLRTSSVLQTIWFALPPRLALLFKYYSTSVRWTWDVVTNEARNAELAVIISYPTSASRIIVLLKPCTKYREFFTTLFVKQLIFSLFLILSRHE